MPKVSKFCCWVRKHDAHGLSYDSPIWLPEGDRPEVDPHKWFRVPRFDMNEADLGDSAEELNPVCGAV